MPPETEFQAALTRVQSYAEKFDISVNEVLTQDIEDEPDITHIVLEDQGQTFFISGQPDKEYFSINFPFNILNFITNGLDIGDAGEIIADPNHVELGDEKLEEDELQLLAARELLMSADYSKIEQLRQSLSLVGSSTHVLFNVEAGEEIPLVEFTLTTYIFPYEPDFTFQSFSEKVLELISTGSKASNIVQYSTSLQVPDEDEESEYELIFHSNI